MAGRPLKRELKTILEHEIEPKMNICGYILGETIGHGTFGKVKVGYFVRDGTKVAIKILNRKKMKSMDVVGKVRREIKHLQKFQHPHIIKLYKAVSTPSEIFMIMEFAAGGECFNYIVKKGRLKEDESRKFFQQLISGVEYLHRNMVVHRDLKPENLLLDEDKNIKIADFGLSNIMCDGEFLATSCGSPNYAAPEVISANLYAGPEVDIWSCGVILYAFLCGSLPFDDDNVVVLFQKIKAGNFRIPSVLTAGPTEVLRGMLCVNPTKRWTIDEIKRHRWFRKDLPAYLFPLMSDAETSLVDRDAIRTVAEKFGCDETEVATALLSADPRNYMRIAYHIIVDNREFEQQKQPRPHLAVGGESSPPRASNFLSSKRCLNACMAPGQRFCRPDCDLCPKWGAKECVFGKFVPSIVVCDTCEKYGEPGCIFSLEKLRIDSGMENEKVVHAHPERIRRPSALSHTLEYQGGSPVLPPHASSSPALNSEGTPQAKRGLQSKRLTPGKSAKWHLGIRSNCDPVDIMREIYKIMKAMDFEWQILNPFHCIVRRRKAGENASKIRLQLYQADNRGGYLLDFKSLVDEQLLPPAGIIKRAASTGTLTDVEVAMSTNLKACSLDDEAQRLMDIEECNCNKTSQTMQFFDMCAALIQALART